MIPHAQELGPELPQCYWQVPQQHAFPDEKTLPLWKMVKNHELKYSELNNIVIVLNGWFIQMGAVLKSPKP